MNISPIFACGPNGAGFVIFVCAIYGWMGAGALSLGSGVSGVICMFAGKKKASTWLFSAAGALALIAGGVFLWVRLL